MMWLRTIVRIILSLALVSAVTFYFVGLIQADRRTALLLGVILIPIASYALQAIWRRMKSGLPDPRPNPAFGYPFPRWALVTIDVGLLLAGIGLVVWGIGARFS